MRWAVASQFARRLCTKHHLTSPLLRNGSLPLPRFAAERTVEGERYGHGLDTLLRGTRFYIGETIAVESSHEVRVKDLARGAS